MTPKEHMKAYFKEKAKRKITALLPNKKDRALYDRYFKELEAERKAKEDNPMNKPYKG